MKMYSIAENDNGGFCECEECEKANGGRKKIGRLKDFSDLYFKWCNKVVERVLEKYPGKFFGCLAYRETQKPPSFKIHPNIVVVVAVDMHQHIIPEKREFDRRNLAEWSKKASNLGIWEYGFTARDYSIPRLPIHQYSDFLRFLKKHNGSLFFSESASLIGEGPKRYVYYKLAFDTNENVDALLHDWCAACVGRNAGKYLEQYYRWCISFWTSDAVKNTPWGKRTGTYFERGMTGKYLMALKPDDLPRCRKIMEKMLAEAEKSGDPDQKYRAEKLMEFYDFHEGMAYLGGGGFLGGIKFDVVGSFYDSKQLVLKMIDSLPDITKTTVRLPEIIYRINAGGFGARLQLRAGLGVLPEVFLNAFFAWRDDPEVRKKLMETLSRPEIPAEARRKIAGILDFNRKENLLSMKNTDAAELELWKHSYKNVKVSIDKTAGKRRIKVTQPGGTWLCARRYIPYMRPDRDYAVEATVSSPFFRKDMSVRLMLCSSRRLESSAMDQSSTHFHHPGAANAPIRMQTCLRTGSRAYNGILNIVWNGMKEGEYFFIDDIRLVELGGDPPGGKKFMVSGWTPFANRKNTEVSGKTLSMKGAAAAVSSNFIKAVPGKDTIRYSVKIKGKGVVRLGILARNADGKSLHTECARPMSPDFKDWTVQEFVGKIPLGKKFDGAAGFSIYIENRKGELQYKDAEGILFPPEPR